MSYDASIQITYKGDKTLLYGKYLGGGAARNAASFAREFLDGKEIKYDGSYEVSELVIGGVRQIVKIIGGADDHVDLDLDNKIATFQLWPLPELFDSASPFPISPFPFWTQFDQCNWKSIPMEDNDATAAWISAQAKGENIADDTDVVIASTHIKMPIQDFVRLFEVISRDRPE